MVLKRIGGSEDPQDPNDNGNADGDDDLPTDATPRMVVANRPVSEAGLMERIAAQFNAETAGRPDLFAALDEAGRRALLRDVVDYVLAVEIIRLPRSERLHLIETAYQDFFHFGPLAPLLADPAVTEVEVAAFDRVYARLGDGVRTLTPNAFTDHSHWDRVLSRALTVAGVHPDHGEAMLEVGAQLGGRPARIEVTSPPVSALPTASIRLHPPKLLSLPDLIRTGAVSEGTATPLLEALNTGRGLMIAGEPGAGKTTLLNALLHTLAGREAAFGACYAVERASELRLPDAFQRLGALPAGHHQLPISFAAQIEAALAGIGSGSGLLVLDEVRFDEAEAMWAALTLGEGAAKRQLVWAFRASTDANRLRTAFSMSVRRAAQSIDQAVINSALVGRLPIVAFMVGRRLTRVCEWTSEGDQLTLQTLAAHP